MSNLAKATEIYLFLIDHPESRKVEGYNFAKFSFKDGRWWFLGESYRIWMFSFIDQEELVYEVNFTHHYDTLLLRSFKIHYEDLVDFSWSTFYIDYKEITEDNYK